MRVENYVIGMDCGTTNIKAVLVGEDGSVVAEAGMPNRFIRPGPSMQEQDADEWWSNAVMVFRALREQAGAEIMEKVRGISVSSQTVSMLPVDGCGRPLRNAITYQDGRSVTELRDIVEQIGEEKFICIVGGQPAVAFLPNKILWYKKNEPELFRQTEYFLQASSYINYRLTGVMVSDVDQAARTQCLDISTMNWSEEIGRTIDVHLEKMLPPLALVDEVIGSVTAEASRETGIPVGVPVVAGCSDAMASIFAIGISKLGEAGESSGTSSLFFVGSEKKSAPDIPVVTKPCPIEGMPWVFDAPISSTGASIKWFIENFGDREMTEAKAQGKNIFNYLNELALGAEPGSGGLFFYPYLLGERAPLWNDYARSMFIGLDMNVTREALVRSVFEGTAYALRHVMETIKSAGGQAECLRICGGGAKSRTWSRIKASMLQMPVYVLNERSGNVPIGDALIAGHRVGVFPSLTEAAERIIQVDEIIQPDDKWARAYDELYPYYVDMYRHLDSDLCALRKSVESLKK